MGGTQTVVLPNGKIKVFDDREFYSGRGAKYNKTVRHDDLGFVKVSRKEYSAFLKHLKESEKAKADAEQKRLDDLKNYAEFEKKGEYKLVPINENSPAEGSYLLLSEEEKNNKTFNPTRLARTLNIYVDDAKLLLSRGKTYVFATELIYGKPCGRTILLYHPSLSCNSLSIHVSYPDQSFMDSFKHEEWYSAPYAKLLGQTPNKNHFVC